MILGLHTFWLVSKVSKILGVLRVKVASSMSNIQIFSNSNSNFGAKMASSWRGKKRGLSPIERTPPPHGSRSDDVISDDSKVMTIFSRWLVSTVSTIEPRPSAKMYGVQSVQDFRGTASKSCQVDVQNLNLFISTVGLRQI